MTQVISVKFNEHGKCYYFNPRELEINTGDTVVVETAKGLELAECARGNHGVSDNSVVSPLRPVVRLATPADLRVAEINKKREAEAFEICEKKIAEHGLDMKLVNVECNFEGNKTTFFFTADGRVDFRELVKDLAGVFRNRIELRQIGVRDEAKMLGGLGICGRPYCCSLFMNEFQPVSTKMAKIQNLSLNPTKISGSCGRLMCCLRYEQPAYEDLVRKVPKLGTFVETPAGYGTVSQTDLLRESVKVRLDGEGEAVFRTYRAEEIAVVPGGRPRDGERPPSVLKAVVKPAAPEEAPDEPVDDWLAPNLFAVPMEAEQEATDAETPAEPRREGERDSRRRDNSRRNSRRSGKKPEGDNSQKPRQPVAEKTDKPRPPRADKPGEAKPKDPRRNYHRRSRRPRPKPGAGEGPKTPN